MEAISHAGTVLGVLAKDGIVLAAEKKVTGKLLDLSGAKEGGYGGSGEKIFLLNSCVISLLPPSRHVETTYFVCVQKCSSRCSRNHGRCKLARELRPASRAKTLIQLQRGYPCRATCATSV